ncbi:MAG: hypothetical protein OXJ53_04495, partial [Gammaproteobacteria bacterium]|nr:hypothetical protein [Gammaproteobacteria bacterium]
VKHLKIIDYLNLNRTLVKAHRDSERWSGVNNYLRWAPEYLATTYIAREISTIRRPHYLTLEKNVREAIKQAGGSGPGRPPKDLRTTGRFDIVLWYVKPSPRAVIEVKRQPDGFATLRGDVARICSTLSRETDIGYGLMAYYISFDTGAQKHSVDRLTGKVEKISKEARDFTRGKGMKLKRYHHGPIKKCDDSAWTAEVLKISR